MIIISHDLNVDMKLAFAQLRIKAKMECSTPGD